MDREKVIKGLETCIKYIDRECPIGCPYHEVCTKYEGRVVFQPVLRDAFELLKEQEAVKIEVKKINDSGRCGRCPNCLMELNEMDYPNYCGFCGQKVKWE